jgi:hypothetical protein
MSARRNQNRRSLAKAKKLLAKLTPEERAAFVARLTAPKDVQK